MIAQYSRLFRWHVLRHLAAHRLLATLNVATVALGVALYLAIRIANQSADHAFSASIDMVAGKAQLEVNAPSGDLPDRLFPKIAQAPGVAAATPIVRGFVSLPQFPGEYLDLLGIDLFTNEPFRTFELGGFQNQKFDLQTWLRGPRTIALSEGFARQHHLQAGDELSVQENGESKRLTIEFLLHDESAGAEASSAGHFGVMDLGWAQEFLGESGRLDSVSIRLQPNAKAKAVAAELRKIVPPDATVAPPARRSEEVEKMLSGFQLNLEAMSLVALLVGMFLVYNTIEASVVRRRAEIGILRSLGASRAEVRGLFLGEAAVLGLIGIGLGMIGGYFLARVLVGAVSETISSLYVLVSVRRLTISPWTWASAAIFGFAAVMIAAWLPARAASRIEPVKALHGGLKIERSARLSRGWIWAGLGFLLIAIFLSVLALQTGPPWLGFGAAFFVLGGFSLLSPPVTKRLAAAFCRLFYRAIEPRIAAQNLARALLRNSVTIASLAAAVAMTVGVAVMVFSFRQTVSDWIQQSLVADLFIGPAANEIAGPTSFIPAEAIRFLEKNPAVTAVDTFRQVDLPFRDATISVAVISGRNRRNLHFLRGNNDQILDRFYHQQCVLVSESFARRYQVNDRSTLQLPTPTGIRAFPIAGIFYDYTSDRGVVFLSKQVFAQLWHDDRVNSVGVFLRPESSATKVAEDFRQHFSREGEFSIYSNRTLRARIFEVFDQTFAVTYVLRTIAVLVAIVGVFLGLTTLVAERTRELAVLRSLGASARQVRRLLLWESGMVGMLASGLGVVSGLCLSFVLTGVINRAFFGWTIQLAFPWSSLAWTPVWIVGAAVIAGWIPAWRAGRLNVAEAIRSE